jgi:hypothetical protein
MIKQQWKKAFDVARRIIKGAGMETQICKLPGTHFAFSREARATLEKLRDDLEECQKQIYAADKHRFAFGTPSINMVLFDWACGVGDMWREVRAALANDTKVWQDISRTYTSSERALDQRLDCSIVRLVAA